MKFAKTTWMALCAAWLTACGGGGGDSGTPVGGPAQSQLVTTLDAGSTLVAVDGTNIFYTKADGSARLRTATGAETVIAMPSNTSLVDGTWRVGSGNVFALGTNPVDPAGTSVYRWKDGLATRLVNPTPVGTGAKTIGSLTLAYPFAVWTESGTGDAGHLTVYNTDTPSFRRIDIPPTATRPPTSPSGVAVGGVLRLTFLASALPVGSLFIDSAPTDVYTWDSNSAASTQITNTGLTTIDLLPSTDGSRLSWLSRPASGPVSLITGTFGTSGSSVLVAATPALEVTQYVRTDSTVAWIETTATGTLTPSRALKASVAGGAVTVIPTQALATPLFAGPGGHIVYSDSGAFYAWSSVTGRKPLTDVSASTILVSGDTGYYVKTGTQQLFKVSLN